MPDTLLNILEVFSPSIFGTGNVVIPTYSTEEDLSHRQVESHVQGHLANKLQKLLSNLDLLESTCFVALDILYLTGEYTCAA